ncbi:hypothetical protein ACHAXT_000957 [Thalassiosira profunda]
MKRLTALSTAFCVGGCLPALSLASAFIGPPATRKRPLSWLGASATGEATSADVASNPSAPSDARWASHALLFSSLTDGVAANDGAQSFLRYSLADALLREHISQTEDALESSVKFSPCNGPDVEELNSLESVDQLHHRGLQFSLEDFENKQQVDSWAKDALQQLASDANCNNCSVRVLYIPTAMYALNPHSQNTPGKQRQRARADGKKRRTQLLALLDELLSSEDDDALLQYNLLATTLDLDDGSLKQPVGSEDASLFPADDKEALTTWKPHIIYVEGGNTFWLQHCIDKGGYAPLIKNACAGPSAAVYLGKSAGAIVAGSEVSMATWKGWDDPSVVPGKETYDDWLDVRGFDFVGSCSFFPHMSDDWKDLVQQQVDSAPGKFVCSYCLREEDACCVVGEKELAFLTSGPKPVNPAKL